jgi:hypothetical protein
MLVRYWFEFDIETAFGYPLGIGYGCGITAYNMNDALKIMDEKIFSSVKRPPFKIVKENVDVSTLDQGHVIPNMKHHLARGIWFPLGYD